MVARVAVNTGWTWDHVENTVTAARLVALTAYWRQVPPWPEVVTALSRQAQPTGNLDELAQLLATR